MNLTLPIRRIWALGARSHESLLMMYRIWALRVKAEILFYQYLLRWHGVKVEMLSCRYLPSWQRCQKWGLVAGWCQSKIVGCSWLVFARVRRLRCYQHEAGLSRWLVKLGSGNGHWELWSCWVMMAMVTAMAPAEHCVMVSGMPGCNCHGHSRRPAEKQVSENVHNSILWHV